VAGGWVGAAPETACGSSKRRRPLELRLLRAPGVEKEKGSTVGSGKGLGRCRSGCGSERAWELHDGGKGYGVRHRRSARGWEGPERVFQGDRRKGDQTARALRWWFPGPHGRRGERGTLHATQGHAGQGAGVSAAL
jgi:hypothetical protein